MNLLHKEGRDIIVERDFFYFQQYNYLEKKSWFYKSDIECICAISEEEFMVIKYGENYRNFFSQLGSNTDSSVKLQDGSVICVGFRDSFFFFIDNAGNVIDKREDIGGDSIYSFDIDKKGNLWYAVPTAHYVEQYSLKHSEKVYSLGEWYEENKPLCYPEDIKIYDNFVYISDMGNHRIVRLNIETKDWIEYMKFEESVWEYTQYKDKEIIRLESGIYYK